MIFENVEVGDKVAVYGQQLSLRYVERVTATTFKVFGIEKKFSRKNGNQQGSDTWHPISAEPWTTKHDEQIARQNNEITKNRLAKQLHYFKWHALELHQLRAAVVALTELGIFKETE